MDARDFTSFDGARLAWYDLGPADGRPVFLLHGLFSTATLNWIKFGHARRLADAGCHVRLLDTRAHGASASPTDAAAYPTGVMERDARAWIESFGESEFDLAGFSLGARASAILVAEGLRPRRLAICGMGLKGITNNRAGTRIPQFLEVIANYGSYKPGSEDYITQQFLKTNKVDLTSARLFLESLADVDRGRLVSAMTMPTAVICGAEDHYVRDARRLAEAVPTANFVEIPGTHMSSVTKPPLGEALANVFSDE